MKQVSNVVPEKRSGSEISLVVYGGWLAVVFGWGVTLLHDLNTHDFLYVPAMNARLYNIAKH